jgi:hypothetical protein
LMYMQAPSLQGRRCIQERNQRKVIVGLGNGPSTDLNEQVLEVEEFGGQHWWRMNLHAQQNVMFRLTIQTRTYSKIYMTNVCLMDQSIATLQ